MENYDEEDQILREPLVAYGKKLFTIEEYLEYENASQEKHEYYNGEIFAMAGGSKDHSAINRNLIICLGNALEKSCCDLWGSDLRLHIPSNSLFTYPDIRVACRDEISNLETSEDLPKVIIEVLSPSTRKYDRDTKFELYKDIPSFQEYILVDSQRFAIDIYRKTVENAWELQQYTTNETSIEIKALELKISFEDIYYGTQLNHQRGFSLTESKFQKIAGHKFRMTFHPDTHYRIGCCDQVKQMPGIDGNYNRDLPLRWNYLPF
jgi:Uma2 family endonuclease